MAVSTKPTRFRVPNLLITRGEPQGSIFRGAPLVCIEIPSPEDRWAKMTVRLNEYLDCGVPEVWVIDPAERIVWICKVGSTVVAADPVVLAGTGIELPLAEIFE